MMKRHTAQWSASGRLLAVLVALSVLVGTAHATHEYAPRVELPGVLGASLADALSPHGGGKEGYASFAVDEQRLVQVEECEAMAPELFKNAYDAMGASVSIAVPVLNPNLAVRVSVDGKMFTLEKHLKVMGSVAVVLELDVFGLFTVHAGVLGTVLLTSETHDSLVSLLEDLGRFVLERHEGELRAEVVRILHELNDAVVRGEKQGKESVASSWDELKRVYTHVADDLRDVRAELTQQRRWKGAYSLLEVGNAHEGEWWSAPLLYRTSVGILLTMPYHIPIGHPGTELERVLEANGHNETLYDTILGEREDDPSHGDVGVGTLALLVRDARAPDAAGVAGKATKMLVRVQSDVHHVDTRVSEAEHGAPKFFDEVHVRVGNRDASPHATVQLRTPGGWGLPGRVLGEVKLDMRKLAYPRTLVPLTLRAGRGDKAVSVSVVARWLPYKEREAFAHIGLPNKDGVMLAEVGDAGAGRPLRLRRREQQPQAAEAQEGATVTATATAWEYARRYGSWHMCSSVEKGAESSMWDTVQDALLGLRPEELQLCHYLARANPPLPTSMEHTRRLFADVLMNHIDSAFALVAEHLDALVADLGVAMAELEHVKSATRGLPVARSSRGQRAADRAADALEALERTMRAAMRNRAAYEKTVTSSIAKHAARMRAELAVASQKLNVEKLAVLSVDGKPREVRLDFAYTIKLGARVNAGDLTVKMAAGVGHGVRGVLNVRDRSATKLDSYKLVLGGVQATVEEEWRVGLTGMLRTFPDRTKSLMVSLEVQAPGDRVAADAVRIRRLPIDMGGGGDVPGTAGGGSVFQKLDLIVRACEIAALATEVATEDDKLAKVGEELEGVLMDTLFDAIVKAAHAKVSEVTKAGTGSGAVVRNVVPGLVTRLFFRADKAGKWSADAKSNHAFFYVMDKAEVSLTKALGPVGDVAGRMAALQLEGSMEMGLWWFFGGKEGKSSPHPAEVLFHGV